MYTIEYKDHVIFDPSKESTDYYLISPKFSAELNKVPSLDFSILPSHTYYKEFDRFKSGIVAKKNGVEIFRGRVVSTSIDTYKQKQVTCEGCLAYLLDTLQPKVYFEQGTCEQVFREIIANHNQMVEDEKKFTVGRITAEKAQEKININSQAHTQTRSLIDQYIIKQKGGYLVTRYENGVNYIDWIEKYDRRPNQKIMFGSNIIDYSEEIVTDDFFTVLSPSGKREYEEVNEKGKTEEKVDNDLSIEPVNNNSRYLEIPDLVEKYGKVYKHEDFGDCYDAAELLKKANDYIDQYKKKLQFGLDIGVIDLNWIEGSADQLMLGDTVRIISAPHDKDLELTVTKVEFDFTSPDQDKFTFGDGIQELTKKTDSEIKEAKEIANRAGSGGVSNNLRLIKHLIDIAADEITVTAAEKLDLNTRILNTTFKYMHLVGGGWNEQYDRPNTPEEVEAMKEELGHDWQQIMRDYQTVYNGELYYNEETGVLEPVKDEDGNPKIVPGVIDSVAFSRFMNSYITTVNTLYTYQSTDEGVFRWAATSQDTITRDQEIESEAARVKQYIKTVGIDMDAPSSQIRLKASSESSEYIGDVMENLTHRMGDAEITLNGSYHYDAETGEEIYTPGIVMQVSKKVGEDEIISAINMSPESIKINSAMVDLGDYATVGELTAKYATITQLDAYYVKGEAISDVSTIEAGTIYVDDNIEAQYVKSTDGDFDGQLTVQDLVVNGTITGLAAGLQSVRLAQNVDGTYSLYQTDGVGTETLVGTFSRAATSLSGSWSSGIFTATTGELTRTTGLFDVTNSDVTWNGNIASFQVYANLDDGEIRLPTGKTLRIDATHAYERGQESAVFEPYGTWNSGYFSIDNGSQEDIYGTELLSLADGDLTWNGTTGTLSIPARINGGSRVYTGQTYNIQSPTPTISIVVGEFDGAEMAYPVTSIAKVNEVEVARTTSWVDATAPGGGGSDESYGLRIDGTNNLLYPVVLSQADASIGSVSAVLASNNINNDSGRGAVRIRVKVNDTVMLTKDFTFNVDTYTRANNAKAGLTQMFSGQKRELFYKYADGSGYASVGSFYWFHANTSGFGTLYTRTQATND